MNIVTGQLARVFSGIQPTGIPHLGNYFGALANWYQLAKHRSCRVDCSHYETSTQLKDNDQQIHCDNSVRCDTPIYCIVDVHAYSSPKTQFGQCLYEQILSTLASLLAIGLNPDNCITFRQSDLFEHNYLDNVLDNFVSTQRLKHMTQFKDKLSMSSSSGDLSDVQKNKSSKSIPNGLLNYPVLQAADILLYRTNLVPVGDDQIQHIELTRDIAKKFNYTFGVDLFPMPVSVLTESQHARRVKSLRDPTKKMSKSDPDQKSFIEIVDEPEVVCEKLKKAITDSISAIYYDAEQRAGISNLMRIHHLVTGDSFETIRDQYQGIESAKYKLMLADILIEYFKPIRQEYFRLRGERLYLEQVLSLGRSKARPLASDTIGQVRKILGSIES